ncbi:MAG: hypothetical protein LUF92_16570 [Clostridiales bacterium]|nr:hypothetical protein [Clostridiales bacterium]
MSLGGIHFLFTSERPIRVGQQFDSFLDDLEAIPDLTVPFLWDWADSRTATTPLRGKDLQQHYYAEDGLRFCQTWGGPKGYIASTVYTPDFRTLKCYVNQEPFINPLNDLTTLIRYMPMREIFQYFGVIFFHAAQVEIDRKGILFTAPSGTGKTTQAKLWQKFRGAELICNDRTLVRKTSEGWCTYGYPVDGSAPVRSGRVLSLGAVVLLEQAPVNELVCLSAAKAVAHLVSQMVIDVWNVEARTRAATLALALLQDVPVCLLRCTPDEGAVRCLECWLNEKEVF